MFLFKLDRIDRLLDATSVLADAAESADLQCSPAMISLIASDRFSQFIVSLQLMPQFFAGFFSDRIHHSRIYLRLFITYMSIINDFGSSSMNFSLAEPFNRVLLEFQRSGYGYWWRELTLSPSEEENLGEIDYTSFASIDSQVFRRIVTEFSCHIVRVTIKRSQVRFSIPTKQFILTKGRCIIGGVGARSQTQFLITLNPMERKFIIGGLAQEDETQFLIILHPMMFFHDLTYRSERVWLFKSMDSCSTIILPIRMYAPIL